MQKKSYLFTNNFIFLKNFLVNMEMDYITDDDGESFFDGQIKHSYLDYPGININIYK